MNVDVVQPRALSVDDAAKSLALGRTSVWRLIRAGQLRPVRLGGRTVIPVSEIDRVLQQL